MRDWQSVDDDRGWVRVMYLGRNDLGVRGGARSNIASVCWARERRLTPPPSTGYRRGER